MGEKKTKNVVIIALCLTLIFMGVGFAALSQNINIEQVLFLEKLHGIFIMLLSL